MIFKRTKWKKIIQNKAFLLFIILFVTLIGIYGIYMGIQYLRVRNAFKQLRENGYPITLEELNEYYPYVPDKENAAVIYQQAFDLYQEKIEGENEFLDEIGTLPNWQSCKNPEKIEAYLTAHKKSLALLRKAAKYKKCRFPIDLTKGPNTMLPHLSNLRQGARLLAMHAILATENKDDKLAMEDILATLKIACHLRNEPVLISGLVHIACALIGLRGMDRLLDNCALTDEELQKLDAQLQELDSHSSMTNIFIGETGFISGADAKSTKNLVFYIASNSPSRGYLNKYNSFTINCLKLIGIHANEQIRWAKWRTEFLNTIKNNDFPKVINETYRKQDEKDKLPDSAYIAKSFGNYSIVTISYAKFLTEVRLARTAIAIERFKLENNRIPNKLTELTPKFLSEIPSNPFYENIHAISKIRYLNKVGEHPLIKKDGDYVLYGIGCDGKDNKGAFDLKKPFKNGTDIILAITKAY